VQELSEAERIEAAQFLLSTRQREEAAMRATHLRGEHTAEDEVHARETLAEMINLQEIARAADAPSAGDRKHADLPERGVENSQSPRTLPDFLMWTLILVLLVCALLLGVWQLQ